MKTILYIHGFNSGPGQKTIDLKQEGFEVITPQLLHLDALADLHMLEQILNELIAEHKEIEVVGTSLGGFYAMCLRNKLKDSTMKFHCINPSYKPHETLKKHLGKSEPNHKTGVKYILKELFINTLTEAFENVKALDERDFEFLNFYIGTKDEVLTFDEIKKIAKNVQYSKQKHRFPDISLVIENLRS